jgi:hypothetical protein
MAFLGVAGVLLVALGVMYQPFNSEHEASNIKPAQAQMKDNVEFTIDSATGTVEEQVGGELRQLLSLVEQERAEARNARKLSSKSSSSGKGKGKGSKSSKSEMPSTAPTISPAPSVSFEPTSPTTMPSAFPTMEGSPFGRTPAPTISPAPSVSSEPTAPTVSPAPSNAPTGSKGSKSSGKGKGKGDSDKGSKSRRERDRRLQDLIDQAEEVENPTFKTGRRQLV